MEKAVEVKFKSKVDDMELEFIYDGTLLDNPDKVLKYQEEFDDKVVDTAIYFSDGIVINRTNGVNMYQEFVVGEQTVMDYSVDGMTFNLFLNTKELINEDNYLRIVYSTEQADVVQEHEIEIYYS